TGTLNGPSTLTINDTAGVYFNGQLTDGATPGQLILVGAANNTVFLTNANSSTAPNNYTGGTLLAGSATTFNVVINDSSAFGANNNSNSLGFQASGATLVATAPVILNQSLVFNGGTVTLSGTSSAANMTFTGNGLLTANMLITDANLGVVTF